LVKSFRLVPASEGPRREFKITLGLRAGYGSAGRIYDLEEAVRTAHRWMWERAARGEPFLSGMFTRGEVVYAGFGGEAASHREPVANFAGEVLPQYASDLDDGTVWELLDELTGEMGRTLVAARSTPWVALSGRASSVRLIVSAISSSPILRGAPGRGSSNNPSRRNPANRCRHRPTRCKSTPSRAAMAVFVRPSAANRIMRARSATACAVLCRRTSLSSSLRSISDSSNHTALPWGISTSLAGRSV